MQAAKRGYMVVARDFEGRQSEVRRAFDLKGCQRPSLDWPSKARWLNHSALGTAFCQKSGLDVAGRRRDTRCVIGQDRRGCVNAAGSQLRSISQSAVHRMRRQSADDATPKGAAARRSLSPGPRRGSRRSMLWGSLLLKWPAV